VSRERPKVSLTAGGEAAGESACEGVGGDRREPPTRLGRREAAVPRATEESEWEHGSRSAERSEATVFRRCCTVGWDSKG